ncbi:hypothetical protein PAPHI01_1619 [Pancytospora philotis]|nr:hypothetical protein PAPHI01_1619 [Pancytospora philotis]
MPVRKIVAKLTAFIISTLLLCCLITATRQGDAREPTVARADSMPRETSNPQPYNPWAHSVIRLYDALYSHCEAVNAKRPAECRVHASEDKAQDPAIYRRQKQYFILLVVLLSEDPLGFLEQLIPLMSYGCLDLMHKEVSPDFNVRLVSKMLTGWRVSESAEYRIRGVFDHYLLLIRMRLGVEIAAVVSMPVQHALKRGAILSEPVEVFQVLALRMGGLSVTSNNDLPLIISAVLESTDLKETSMRGKIDNFIRPLMRHILNHCDGNKRDILYCKYLMMYCTTRVSDCAVFRMYSWDEFRRSPTPNIAMFIESAAKNGIKPYYIINLLHTYYIKRESRVHYIKKESRVPESEICALSKYYWIILDSATKQSNYGDDPIHEDLIERLPANTAYQLVCSYYKIAMTDFTAFAEKKMKIFALLSLFRPNILAKVSNLVHNKCPGPLLQSCIKLEWTRRATSSLAARDERVCEPGPSRKRRISSEE